MSKTPRSAAAVPKTRRSTRNRPTDVELLDAALAVIADVGAGRATMDMIAARAGTSRVTLYAHFGSRDALVDAVLDREMKTLTRWKLKAYDEGDEMTYGDHTRYSVEVLFEYARRNPDGFRVLLTNRDQHRESARQFSAALEPKLAQRLRDAFAARGQTVGVGADVLASMLIGMTLDVAHRAVIVAGASIDTASELAVSSAMSVLRSVDVGQLQAVDRSLTATAAEIHPSGT
ncbi:TetR/AcrR family transcriptional regulator [Nocardia sp. 348MFTsu5.1]|uniref:TetR/AcrR family transcriptional regulator n=1 Tax=Nocardia sp. 348MFTsu5.1 TaxID=1172185 RepID=UPI000371292D|nr:TetR/AcrR family transcriptional regulator [Nocardia sp. 348MFTsu5.1]